MPDNNETQNQKFFDVDAYLKLMHEVETKEFPSLKDSLGSKIESYAQLGSNSKPIKDSYGNSLTATGTEDKVKQFSQYGFSNETQNWPLWLALYNDSWVFKRVIDKPSTDMVRTGITISLQDSKQLQNVYTMLKKFRKSLIDLLKWGALFGGSVAFMMFNNMDEKDYAKQLDVNKLKKSKDMKLYVTDRWYGISCNNNEIVTNMSSLDYGKPAYYTIMFPDGKSYKVHHDYILRYEHRSAPPLLKNGVLMGWGYSEGSHILNELSRDDQLKSAITSLINKALIEVIKMAGMRGIFMGQDEESKNQLEQRLQMVNWGRTFNSLTFLDKEDDYQEHGFSGLSGLSDLLETSMWEVSAAVEMQGVLFGDLKNGFSNDVDALERYDEVILNRCEDYYRGVLEKLLLVIYKKLGIEEKVTFEFNSLLVKKHDEEKMESLSKFQTLLSNMLQDGVIDTKRYAQSLKTYTLKNTVDFNLDDDYIKSLEDKFDSEMEDFDLDKDLENEENLDNQENPQVKIKDSWFKRMFKKRK